MIIITGFEMYSKSIHLHQYVSCQIHLTKMFLYWLHRIVIKDS